MADTTVPQPPAAPVAPKPQASVADVYQNQRNLALRNANQGAQQGADAISRRLAASGSLNSGAGIQAQLQQQAQGDQARQDAIQGINNQEATAANQSAEAQKGRDFQGAESRAQREQQAGQFGQQFGLEQQKQNEAIDMGRKEFNRDTQNLEFNKGVTLKEQGYQLNLLPWYDQQKLAQHFVSQGDYGRAENTLNNNWDDQTANITNTLGHNNPAVFDAIKRRLAAQGVSSQYNLPDSFNAGVFRGEGGR